MPGCRCLGVAAGQARDGSGPGVLFVGRDSSALSRAGDEGKRVLWVGFPVAGSLMLAAPPATVVRTPCEEGRCLLVRCARALGDAWCAGALREVVARIRWASSVARTRCAGTVATPGADWDIAPSFCEPVCTPGLEARRNSGTGWKPIPHHFRDAQRRADAGVPVLGAGPGRRVAAGAGTLRAAKTVAGLGRERLRWHRAVRRE